MSDSIILFHFERSEIRFVGTAEKPEWVAADICKVLGISNTSDTIKDFSENQKGIVIADDGSLTGSQMLTVTEPGMYRLIFKSRKPIAEKFQNWICNEVLPSIRKSGSYSIDQDRQKLEKQFRPVPTTQNRIDAIKLLKLGGHKKEYIQRVTIQMAKAICSDIEAPQPQELISLPTAKALLTPTDIAVHLGWFCQSNAKSGDARKVNKTLAELGYQVKVGSVWSATEKAINLNLCDRKPVETGSRTQKDQLMWSVDVFPILQEHGIISAQ